MRENEGVIVNSESRAFGDYPSSGFYSRGKYDGEKNNGRVRGQGWALAGCDFTRILCLSSEVKGDME